jgi:glycosyltransferase involved in cell wall biosynthesis
VRTLLITSSYPESASDPSGHFVEAEARELARSSAVVVVAPGRGGSLSEGGVVVHRVPGGDAFGWPGVAARLRERPPRALDAALWVRGARAILPRLGPFDRAIAHWAIPSAFPVADRRVSAPLEIVSHGADVRLLLSLPRPARSLVVRRLLRRADEWRFVSTALRDSLHAGLDERDAARLSRIASVRPARIEMPDVRARSRELRMAHGSKSAPLFVCVGRLVPGKRWDAALRHAKRQGAARAKVVVVGDGPLRASLEADALTLGVDAWFVGTTPRAEALAWIGAADAVLHASKTEGLSTVVREAEALGVPVIVVP